jgi:hypothetical protein
MHGMVSSFPVRSVLHALFLLLGHAVAAEEGANATAASNADAAAGTTLDATSARIVAGVAHAAAATRNRLAHDPAHWVVFMKMSPEVTLVDVVSCCGSRRLHVVKAKTADGLSDEILRLQTDDHRWLLSEESGPIRAYRPFEAPLAFPNAYLLLNFADLRYADTLSTPLVEEIDADALTMRCRLDDSTAQRLRQALATVAAIPHPSAEMAAKADNIRAMLQSGTECIVDQPSGIVTTTGFENVIVNIADFHWLAADGSDWPLPADHPLEDHLHDIATAPHADDWAFFLHASVWQPGQKNPALEGDICNLSTNEVRRLPYTGMATVQATFSRDRTKAYGICMDMGRGAGMPTEIDLRTGANRLLAVDDHEALMYTTPMPSPDGTQVALRRIVFGYKKPDQVVTINLATGNRKILGSIRSNGELHWLANGTALLIDREDDSDEDLPPHTICVMDMAGAVREVVRGSDPLPLADGRILFKDGADWKTCAIDGSGVATCGDGLENCGIPTLSPDGTHLLMEQYHGADGPRPVMVTIGNWSVKELDMPAGLWAGAHW